MKTSQTNLFRSSLCAALLCAGLSLTFASASVAQASDDDCQAPYLPTPLCNEMQVPAGHKVASRVFAQGVPIYRWDGASWVFVAPSADLFADVNFRRKIGKVTFIQRVNTVGGLAPTISGTAMDEVAEVPYTTEYYFYRTKN